MKAVWVIMAVIVLASLASFFGGSAAWDRTRWSRPVVARTQMSNFGVALRAYFQDDGRLPLTLHELTLRSRSGDPYTNKIPRDPWGHAYRYRIAEAGFEFTSMGEDGQAGTADDLRMHFVVSPRGVQRRRR